MMLRPFRIHLVRHGEVHNPQQILYGRLPRFRLSGTGQRQARAAGRCLGDRPLAALYSSPLLRARQTAEGIRRHHPHLKIRISSLINEVCTSFEGRPGSEIDARDGDVYTGAGPRAEQPADIVARVRKFIRRLDPRVAGNEVAAVTHGDVITFMVLWAKGERIIPANKTRLLDAGYPQAYPAHASITTLTFPGGDPGQLPEIGYHGTP